MDTHFGGIETQGKGMVVKAILILLEIRLDMLAILLYDLI
jgi:hypothetical protein